MFILKSCVARLKMDRLLYPLENTHFLILSFFSHISLLMKNQFHLWFIIWILVSLMDWTPPRFFIRYITTQTVRYAFLNSQIQDQGRNGIFKEQPPWDTRRAESRGVWLEKVHRAEGRSPQLRFKWTAGSPAGQPTSSLHPSCKPSSDVPPVTVGQWGPGSIPGAAEEAR